MIRMVAVALKNVGVQSWWDTVKVWRFPKTRRVALATNAAVFVPMVAVGLWLYRGQMRRIANLRQTNESLLEQIARSGSGSKSRPERAHRKARAVPESAVAGASH